MGLGSVHSLDWKTWGQEKILTISPGLTASGYQQIINVSHPHPEAWRFMLRATPINCPSGLGNAFEVAFGLVLGNGMSVLQVQPFGQYPTPDESFCYMYWTGSTPRTPKWTSRVKSSDLNSGIVPATPGYLVNVTEVLVGQSIQIGAEFKYETAPAAGAEPYSVRVQAMIAPNVFGANSPNRHPNASQWRPGITPEETGEWSDD